MDDLRCAIADGEMDDAKKMMERMMKAFAEIRGTATTGPAASEEVSKVKKSRKTKGDGEKKPVVPALGQTSFRRCTRRSSTRRGALRRSRQEFS